MNKVSLVVGTDSYVSLEEANVIASRSMMNSDKAYEKWLSLSDSDKEVLLRNSCRDINTLKFDGRRKNLSQILEFPREAYNMCGIGYRLYVSQFVDNGLGTSGSADGGLSAVKQAQVINAVYAGLYNDTVNDVMSLNIQGITSKKAGPIAETYNRGRGSSSEDALMGIYTKKVYTLLAPWLNDSRVTF